MVRLFWCSPDRKISKIFGTSWKVAQNFQPEFPNGKCFYHLWFSPVPSPTPILMRVTCYLVWVVQLVHANPERNFSLGIFAYHLNKPSTNRFSHVNGKQPVWQHFSCWLANITAGILTFHAGRTVALADTYYKRKKRKQYFAIEILSGARRNSHSDRARQ